MVFYRLQDLLPYHHRFRFLQNNKKTNGNNFLGKAYNINSSTQTKKEEIDFLNNLDLYLDDGISLGYSTFTPSSDGSSSLKWMKQTMKWTFQILGITIAYTTRHFVNLLSAVSYGSHLIINAVEGSTKKLVAAIPYDNFKRILLRIPKPIVITGFQMVLIYIGLRIQAPAFFKDKTVAPIAKGVLAFLKINTKADNIQKMPLWLSILSSPLFFLEKLLAKKSKRDIFSL